MGLTIHYHIKEKKSEKRSTANARKKRVEEALKLLHAFAKELESQGIFEEVSELRHFTQEEWNAIDREDEWSWWKIQSDYYTSKKIMVREKSRYIKNDKPEYADRSFTVSPEEAFGFRIYPGRGCEEMNVGACLFPNEIYVNNPLYDPYNSSTSKQLKIKTGLKEWQWHSFCKTQYANEHGINNFLKCHLGVIYMLDKFRESKVFEVDVSDEGDYWEKRDVRALAGEVQEWDTMLGNFAAMLQSAASENDMSIEAPILKYKDIDDIISGKKKETLNEEQLEEFLKILSHSIWRDTLKMIMMPVDSTAALEDRIDKCIDLYYAITLFNKKMASPSIAEAIKELEKIYENEFVGKYRSQIEHPEAVENAIRKIQELIKDLNIL